MTLGHLITDRWSLVNTAAPKSDGAARHGPRSHRTARARRDRGFIGMSIEIEVAESLGHALEVLASGDPQTRAVAGATDVLLRHRLGRFPAAKLVSIADLPELSYVRHEPEGFRFGAATPLAQLLSDSGF